MRSVTRTLLTAGALLIGVSAVAGQAPDNRRPAVLITDVRFAVFMAPVRPAPGVIERLMSFDANADHRISRDELPERMQGLVARGDRNADAVLDADEIVGLVDAASSKRIHVAFRNQASEGLPGVISDLKLPPSKHARALAIVSGHTVPRSVNDPTSSALLGEMRALLDDEEYENFVAAATRLSRGPDIRLRTIGGVVGGVPPFTGSR